MKNASGSINTGSGIPYVRLLQMQLDFAEKQDLLSRQIGKDETRSIWFEKDDSLRAFLQGLLDDETVDGIRVYICNYSAITIPPGASPDHYKNKLTVGMVGTMKVGKAHHDHPEAGTSKQFLAIDPYNHGKICPPDTCPNDDPGTEP